MIPGSVRVCIASTVLRRPSSSPSVWIAVGHPAAREEIFDLADGNDGEPCFFGVVEQGRGVRLHREVVSFVGPLEVPGCSFEGPGDDPTDSIAITVLASDPTDPVELLERDHVLVGGDLKYGVGRRVEDRLAGPACAPRRALPGSRFPRRRSCR